MELDKLMWKMIPDGTHWSRQRLTVYCDLCKKKLDSYDGYIHSYLIRSFTVFDVCYDCKETKCGKDIIRTSQVGWDHV